MLARHQGYAVSLEVRAAMALHGRRIRDVDVALSLADGKPSDAFDSVERWRQRLSERSWPSRTG